MNRTNTPKVSVIMPVYNGERYLREAVESILNQTFADFEFIIVDDGSTDGSVAVLDEYSDPRIKVHRNPGNMGLVHSLNRGISLAHGIYLARQDADDLSDPTRLEQQVAFLDAHPEVVLVGSAYDVIDEEGHRIGHVSVPTDNKTIQRTLVRRNCFGHGSVMMRRELFSRVGLYAGEFGEVEDYELWLRFSEWGCVANLAETLYAWRAHATSKASHADKRLCERLHMLALQRMLARRRCQPGRPGFDPQDLAAAQVVLAVGAALLDEWDTARDALTRAWQLAQGWLEGGGFAEVVEEGLWGAAGWAGWDRTVAVLDQLLTCLPTGVNPSGIRDALARLYRHQAFEAHARGQPQQVRLAAWEYWRRRPLSLFTDRGMASIWLQSWRRNTRA